MNVLNIDLKKINLQIIDTIVEVIGEEFRNIIEERVSNIYDITYNNIEGIQAYYNFLENCKKKELALKFLQNIGIDISSYPIRSYAEPLPSELEKLIKKEYDLNSFVKIDNNTITVVAAKKKHDVTLANNIMRSIQSEFDTKQTITVKFEGS